MDEREEEKVFIQQLQKFWEQRGVSVKIPQIGGRELEVFKLYKAVTKRGGLKSCISKQIMERNCRSILVSSHINHYQKLLLAYEQIIALLWQKRMGYIYDEEMSSNRKKTKIGYEEENQQAGYVQYYYLFQSAEAEDRQHQMEFSGQPLSALLNLNYAKVEKAETIFFIKKSKIQAQASEVKKNYPCF
ncbi:unnamed protein product (macronuclear) [Paramecium tetraurelia]|uniref:ARID domain-containing protein n=1 Tax=Paramecium tetraurelia TaxID=5888 RepID=A0DY87_PARTE|nr:uncharacterized protein GSPATT00002972001 [Paramecium tetraurelia]CAK88004.1 unnamed protein product [Paramecium tetraurelia]|eukprot:XP_001455401.1 hypothetical protein (macronuclear) [Paramecium tetraurelia strain d4-2]